MKKTFSIGLLALAAVTLAGCSDESNTPGNGRGRVSVSLDLDAAVTQAQGRSRAAEDISVDDLKLKMTSADGSYFKTWDSASDFNAETSFAVGEYSLEAFYGDGDTEGFEAPYYYGATNVTVTDGGESKVSMTAALANSMVSVEYTEAFCNYFTAYGAQLHSQGGSYIDYPAEETRPAYVKPGQCDIIISITKPNGTSATLQPTSFTAKAKTLHKVTFDVNNGQVGDAVLTISFDDTVLDGETIEIDLSDELMNAPAPVATAKGFTDGETISIIEGTTPAELRANIVARGGLQSATLTTQSRSLISQGWPAEIDLMSASDADYSAMKALGLETLGLRGNADKLASIDLAGVVSHIAYLASGGNTTTFALQVKDKYGKVMEQALTLNVEVDALRLEMANAATAYLGGNSVELDLIYNGDDINDVTMQTVKASGSGTYANTDFTVLSNDGDTYRVKVTVPEIAGDVKLRAKAGSLTTDLTVKAIEPPFDLTYSENNVFATHAQVELVNDSDESASDVAARATLYVSTDGTNYTKANATLSGATYSLTGLTPGTEYYARVDVDGVRSLARTFTTEEALQIPNGNLDAAVTINGSGSYWENVVFEGWGTNNAMTTSQPTGGNPAGNNRPYKAISGTIQADGVSGKCALIRNVGWGSNNSALGDKGTSGTCKYTDTGLLHLGSTRVNRPTGYGTSDNVTNSCSTGPVTTDDLDCGISFASRPSSMTFKYKYEPKNSADKGYALITVYNAAGDVVATKDVLLNASSSSSFGDMTVSLDYPAGADKGAKLYVKFLSSYSMEYIKRTNDNYSGPGFGVVTKGFMGSQLYIDEVTLNY